MKILFLTHYFPPESNAPASRVHEMAKRWVANGHEVQVITCIPNVPNGIIYKGYRNRLKQTEWIDGIQVTRIWTYIAANRGRIRRIMNYVTYMMSAVMVGFFVKKPDVLIATSPQLFCGLAGVILKRMRHIPFILEVRDIWPESIVTVGAMTNQRIIRVLEMLERAMYRSADTIVTVGKGYRQRLIEKGVDEKKIQVVMNGVDQDIFSPRKLDICLCESLGIKDKFVCSYIGTVGMACGLEIVVRAADVLKRRGHANVHFLIVGDGAERRRIESNARAKGLTNITFTGRQPKEMIPAYFSVSNVCLVHLKRTDLFKTVMPSKIFEAAGMAKPIINGVSGFAENFIKEAGAGEIIEPDNEEALVQVLLKLAKDAVLCMQYGQSGYEYVTKNFCRNNLAANYIDIIETNSGAKRIPYNEVLEPAKMS